MKCTKPLTAYYLGTKPNGKKDITFSFREATERLGRFPTQGFAVPCGHCAACRRRKRQDMTVRLMKETDYHNGVATFVTLTYNDEHLPFRKRGSGEFERGKHNNPDYIQSLYKHDIQAFLKRLRRQIEYHYGIKHIRFAVAGEYGKKHIRPHWHLIIFGWQPTDQVIHENRGSYNIYRSAFVEKCWREDKTSLGFVTVGCGNGAVARYCAKYITKDGIATDEDQVKECFWTSKQDGGIGYPWLQQYYREVISNGFVLSVDRRTKQAYKYTIPKYYIKALEKIDEESYRQIKTQFEEYAKEHNSSMTDEQWLEYWDKERRKQRLYDIKTKREVRRYEDGTREGLRPIRPFLYVR